MFGRTAERQMERELIAEYTGNIDKLLASLNADNHAAAVEVARVPELIKGYGHVKERNVKAARLQSTALMAAFASARPAAEMRAA